MRRGMRRPPWNSLLRRGSTRGRRSLALLEVKIPNTEEILIGDAFVNFRIRGNEGISRPDLTASAEEVPIVAAHLMVFNKRGMPMGLTLRTLATEEARCRGNGDGLTTRGQEEARRTRRVPAWRNELPIGHLDALWGSREERGFLLLPRNLKERNLLGTRLRGREAATSILERSVRREDLLARASSVIAPGIWLRQRGR